MYPSDGELSMNKALGLIHSTGKKNHLSKYNHNFLIYNNTGAVGMAHLVKPHENQRFDLQHR